MFVLSQSLCFQGFLLTKTAVAIDYLRAQSQSLCFQGFLLTQSSG